MSNSSKVAKQYETAATLACEAAWSYPDRERKIAEAAYFLAEKRGFKAGRDMEDWLTAEEEVDAD